MSTIVLDLCARDINDAIAGTRYALSKQVTTVHGITTSCGVLHLTPSEREEVSRFLEDLLQRRLDALEVSS